MFAFSGLIGQNFQIDSLKLELAKNLADTSKVNLYYELSQVYYDIDLRESKLYADSSLFYALKSGNHRLAAIYNTLGVIESENNREDSARLYFDKALKALDDNEDKTLRGIVYGNYSTTYDNSNNFEKELEYSLKAIELNKDIDSELCFLYYNHAVIYEDAGFHEEALHYLNLAKDISNRSKEYRIESYALKSLALFAIEDGNLSLAEKYLKQGIAICEETNSLEICHHMYFTLGKLQTEQGLYSEAEDALLKAKDFALERNFENDVVASEVLLANLEYQKGNFEEAAKIYNSVNSEIFKVENLWFANIVYKNHSITEERLGNHKKANALLKTYVQFADSIHLSKNRTLLTQADRKYKVEKKDKEILEQQLLLKEQENENKFLWALAGVFLLGAIGTWFIFQQRQKRKNQEILTLKKEQQIKSLEALIRGEEKERSRIAKDLHDGVNGDLSAIKHRLSKYQNQTGIDLSEAIGMVDESCDEVRAISHNLLPPALEKYSLRESLADYFMNLNEIRKEQLSFQYVGDDFNFSKTAEVTIFRIVQELVTNSLKHAEASDILVQLTSFEDTIQLTIEDDGKGFDKDEIKTLGLGLANVKSRVEYLNGELDVQSGKDGTYFNITFNKQNLNEG